MYLTINEIIWKFIWIDCVGIAAANRRDFSAGWLFLYLIKQIPSNKIDWLIDSESTRSLFREYISAFLGFDMDLELRLLKVGDESNVKRQAVTITAVPIVKVILRLSRHDWKNINCVIIYAIYSILWAICCTIIRLIRRKGWLRMYTKALLIWIIA